MQHVPTTLKEVVAMSTTSNIDVQVNPLNRNQTLMYGSTYQGLPVMTVHGPFVTEYLEALHRTLCKSLQDHPRTCAIRFDLRFPQGYFASDELTTNLVISRFVASLKEKIEHDRRRALQLNRYAHQTRVRYVWAREVGVDGRVHYHFALLLNGDAYFTLGRFDSEHDNLFKRITSAWASAMGLEERCAEGLVHFPDHPVYRVCASQPDSVADFFHRASYLCKLNTKSFGFGHHGFGYSRT